MLYDNSTDNIYSSSTEQRRQRHKRSGSDGIRKSSANPHALSSAVTRFISAVDGMNDTIMVPCRLLDMEMNKKDTTKPMPDLLQSGQDPYAVYSLLNSTKNDLIFGLSSNAEEEEETRRKFTDSDKWSSPITNTTSNNKTTNTNDRKISSISLMSLGSSASSCDSGVDSDVTEEVSNADSESCVSSEESSVNTVEQASAELRQHLSGLQACLNQLSDTAFFITERYQEELGHQ